MAQRLGIGLAATILVAATAILVTRGFSSESQFAACPRAQHGFPHRPAPPDSASWRTYHDQDGNWYLRYPRQWHVQDFSDLFMGTNGVLLSNTGLEVEYAKNTTLIIRDLRKLPADGVVVEMSVGGPRVFGSSRFDCRPLVEPVPGFYLGERGFPLDLSQAESWDSTRFTPPGLRVDFVADGGNGEVTVYLGPEVTEKDYEIASNIVSSMDSTCIREPQRHVRTATKQLTFRFFAGSLHWR